MAFPNSENFFSTGIQFYATLSILFGLFVSIFWMIVGWRAMRAHEKISEYLSEDLEQKSLSRRVAQRNDRKNTGKSFRDFLDANPAVGRLESTEQMRQFTDWKNE